MTDSTDGPLSEPFDALTEARAFTAARRHVGAAGFAQSSVLEQIISAGREQIAVTRSLRQVVVSTQAQLQALPLAQVGHASQAHVAALEDIVASGRKQIGAADELRPTLSEVVRQQEADLKAIIAAAITEANTVEQIRALKRVSAEAQTRLVNAAHDREERALAQLDLLGAEALERVRSLEALGQTHAVQRAELQQQAEADQRSISALEATETQNLAEIAQMEQEGEASRERIGALETSAVKTRQHLEELRDVREDQARRERDLKADADSPHLPD